MNKQRIKLGEKAQRIKKIIDSVGGINKFCSMSELPYTTVHSWVALNRIPLSCIEAIHRALPWVSLEWVLFGEGDMVKDKSGHDKFSYSDGFKSFLMNIREDIDRQIESL